MLLTALSTPVLGQETAGSAAAGTWQAQLNAFDKAASRMAPAPELFVNTSQPFGDEAEVSPVLSAAEVEASAETGVVHPKAPPVPPSHTAVVEEHSVPSGPQSCNSAGRLPEEPQYKTVLHPKRRCRGGWQDFPRTAIVIANNYDAYNTLKANNIIDDTIEMLLLVPEELLPSTMAAKLSKSWSGQNHFVVHSKKTYGHATVVDRLLRMSSAQDLLFVVTSDAEAKYLTAQWKASVASMFDRHPRLGLLGGHAALREGAAVRGSEAGTTFSFVDKAIGGPFVVRREAYMQASVFLSSSETCGDGVGECADPAQVLSGRIWAAGFQVGHLPTMTGPPPSPCPSVLLKPEESTVSQLVKKANAEKNGVTEKIISHFTTTCTCSRVGPNQARMSAIVQYFRRPEGVRPISDSYSVLAEKGELDIIINDDSMTEGAEWMQRLRGDAFVVYSHNVHEIRGYNRLTRFANTDYVAHMQDDDIPKDTRWASRAVGLFESHPRLGLIGGFRGRMDVGKRFDKSTGQVWGKKYGPNYLKIPLMDPQAGAAFMPCYKVNAAPLFVDRRVFYESGAYNLNFSCVGDSGIDFDFEYSIRMWKTGYHVALAEFRLRHGAMDKKGSASKSGTRADKKKWAARRDAERFNNAQLYAMYPGFHNKAGTALAMKVFNEEKERQAKHAAKGKRG